MSNNDCYDDDNNDNKRAVLHLSRSVSEVVMKSPSCIVALVSRAPGVAPREIRIRLVAKLQIVHIGRAQIVVDGVGLAYKMD